jgi:hypothetical protein
MKIGIGSDHAGYRYKEEIKRLLKQLGHEVRDFGTNSEISVDYPAFIRPVAEGRWRGARWSAGSCWAASHLPEGNRAAKQPRHVAWGASPRKGAPYFPQKPRRGDGRFFVAVACRRPVGAPEFYWDRLSLGLAPQATCRGCFAAGIAPAPFAAERGTGLP